MAPRRRSSGWAFVVVGFAVIALAEVVGRALTIGELVTSEPTEMSRDTEGRMDSSTASPRT